MVGAVLALAGVVVATWVVLREVMAYDRPAVPVIPVAPVAPVVRPTIEPEETSIFAGLATVEHDEHPMARRVGAALVLVTGTLLVAGAVGAGIYTVVAGLK